jgi:hypothetical protein
VENLRSNKHLQSLAEDVVEMAVTQRRIAKDRSEDDRFSRGSRSAIDGRDIALPIHIEHDSGVMTAVTYSIQRTCATPYLRGMV